MLNWIKELDRLLRGEATRLSALRRGTIEIAPDGLSIVLLLLGLLYGVCMGCYALFQTSGASFPQFIATIGKVPVLFLLTLVVTFPSLYVFNALVGSRLTLSSVFRLILAALGIMVAVLASFGPIVAFFSASTTSYQFMLLLNVVVFAVSGFLGLKFLLHTLHRLSVVQAAAPLQPVTSPNGAAHHSAPSSVAQRVSDEDLFATAKPGAPLPPPPAPPRGATAQTAIAPPRPAPAAPVHRTPVAPAPASAGEPAGALDRLEDHTVGSDVTTIFRIWIIVFGLVGAQMSWVLRPFLGHPGREFMFFAPRESNFFEAVFKALASLLS